MGIKLEQNASITIVENKKVTCGSCLLSEITDSDLECHKTVYCKLNPDPIVKWKEDFCAQGMWLVEGEVMSFKDAFKHNYNRQANKKLSGS